MASTAARPTFAQFACVYVLFSALMIAAVFAAEVSPNLARYRTIYFIWATTVLLTPALAAFVFLGYSRQVDGYWSLFWTFSYLAYLLHFYWAVFVVFDGLGDAFNKQGAAIAIPNYILTVWWGFDVLLLWLARKREAWIQYQRFAVHLYVFLVFLVTTLVLKDGFVRILGVVMTAVVVTSILARVYSSLRVAQSAEDVQAGWF